MLASRGHHNTSLENILFPEMVPIFLGDIRFNQEYLTCVAEKGLDFSCV